jgi:hypothetical protein
MRILPIGAAFAAMFTAGIGVSQAAPASFASTPDAVRSPLVKVQLVCNHARCIDPRNGAYTQSSCNRNGCYPISGVIGRTNPNGSGYGYGSSYPERRWDHRHERDYNWGR